MPQSLKKEVICIAPDFLGEFECIGSKCLHTCCSSAWKISIDKRTYQKYLRAPVCEDTRRLLERYTRKNNSKNVADPVNEYADIAVSYTHLDVYKRQALQLGFPLQTTRSWRTWTTL